MYISLNWLREFVDFDYTHQELDHILTMLGIEVESIINYKDKYKNFYTAEVIQKEKHPDADKLSICTVFDGESKKQVVCGAANVAQHQKVCFGRIDAVIPQSKIKLEKRKIRGIESNGMICSQFELEIGDDKSGIWVLPEDTQVGVPISKVLDLDDIVFEISVTPNRADCLSHLGIAREIAAYTGNKLKQSQVIINDKSYDIDNIIRAIIEDKEKCPRYTARIVRNVKVQESPTWLKSRLTKLGLRPINNIVDATNFVLLECGQPLHAFDLNKLEGNVIVKTVANSTKFTTLDSKERILDNSMLMICDSAKPIAIGGVMGGENSEINNGTTDILIESAYFNPSSIRRTSKKLAILSDASYRFERGVDIDNIVYALNRVTDLIKDLTGGDVVGGLIDEYPLKKEKSVISMRYKRASDIIGVEVTAEQSKRIFENLHFSIIKTDAESITVEIPQFRVDIKEEIDLIEEVARLINYDNIESSFFSNIDFGKKRVSDELTEPAIRKEITDFLVHNGFNQIMTQNMLDKVSSKLFAEELIEIANPLGEELSIMRPSLIPSMLKTIERNIRVGKNNLKLFEIGTTFNKIGNDVNTFIEGILEKEELLVATTGKAFPKQWSINDRNCDFYDIKGIYENLIAYLKIEGIELKLAQEDIAFSINSIDCYYKNQKIGKIGEIKMALLKQFGLDQQVFAISIDLKALNSIPRPERIYRKISPYPSIVRDIAFVVEKTINAEDIKIEIVRNGGTLLKSVEIFDVYSGKSIEENKKSIAFNLTFSSSEKTLVDTEVEEVINKIITTIENRFNSVLRKF